MRTGHYPVHLFEEKWDFNSARDSWGRKHSRGGLNRNFLNQKKRGFTLNICCGKDRTGNVRVDLDSNVQPDIIADVRYPPFKNDSFDTVICDPPFSMYSRFKWLSKIFDLSRKLVIISTPPLTVRMGRSWDREVWFIDAGHLFMRIWQIFTRHPCLVIGTK